MDAHDQHITHRQRAQLAVYVWYHAQQKDTDALTAVIETALEQAATEAAAAQRERDAVSLENKVRNIDPGDYASSGALADFVRLIYMTEAEAIRNQGAIE
jgi:hypothetical protein